MKEKFDKFLKAVTPMVCYNSASILFGGAPYIISLYFLSYLTEVEGLSTKQAGLVLMFAHVWDAITDPAMGIITDRTRSRYGKHRRYILWGVVPIAISYFMLWNSFGISSRFSSNTVMVYYIAAYMLFNTAFTLVCVPHTAMLPELAPEYSLRTQYKSIEYIMNSVGMVSSFVLVSITLGFFNMEQIGPNPETRSKYTFLGLVLAIWFSLPLILTFFFTKEKSSVGMRLPPLDVHYTFNEYKLVFKNKAFRRYFALSTFYSIARGFYSSSNQFFINHAAKLWKRYNITNTVAGVAEASGFPINYALTMKFGKQFCGKLLGPIMLLGLGLTLFINDSIPENTRFILLCASIVLYYFGYSGVGFVGTNTQPDVTDVDEMITGRRREGVISTFNSFIKKTVNGVISAATGYILDAFGFKTGENAVQTSTGLMGIRFTYSILPMIFAVLAIIAIYGYKMNKSDHEMIRAAIAEKKEKGFVTLTDEQKAKCEELSGQKWEDMWIGTLDSDTVTIKEEIK